MERWKIKIRRDIPTLFLVVVFDIKSNQTLSIEKAFQFFRNTLKNQLCILAYNKTRPDKGTNHQINSGNKRLIAHNSPHKRTC
jgi:hypothetical protein